MAFGYVDNFDPQDSSQLEELPYLEFPQAVNPQSAQVTNMTYAALSMRDGDPFSKQFGGETGGDADWFKLSIYGTDAGGNLVPGVVEFYLADFRFAESVDDYIVDAWSLVDLSSLAGVTRLYFNLSSSDSGQFGMNTPSTFAIDDLRFAQVPEPSAMILAAVGAMLLAPAARRRRGGLAKRTSTRRPISTSTTTPIANIQRNDRSVRRRLAVHCGHSDSRCNRVGAPVGPGPLSCSSAVVTRASRPGTRSRIACIAWRLASLVSLAISKTKPQGDAKQARPLDRDSWSGDN